jgi:gas vesicle protein
MGLLFAPRSGTRTRVLLARRTKQKTEYIKNQATALRDSAAEMVERGQRQAMRHKENLARAVENGRRAYRQAMG